MNSVNVIGKIVNVPQLTEISETVVCDLRVQLNARDVVDASAFGRIAVGVAKKFSRGDRIGIVGHLRATKRGAGVVIDDYTIIERGRS